MSVGQGGGCSQVVGAEVVGHRGQVGQVSGGAVVGQTAGEAVRGSTGKEWMPITYKIQYADTSCTL